MNNKIKVGVVGGTGYTGVELLRLLARHPKVDLQIITSRAEAGRAVSELFPNLRHVVELNFSGVDDDALAACDVVYFATPNGVAMKSVPRLLNKGVKVIDLAADFRIKDIATWEHWYGMSHECPEAVAEAVYGLPEVNREQVRQARLIANPGCYPTSVQLGLLPLLEQGLIDHSYIVADCKSGVSGAGRKADIGTSLCEVSESFKAYAVSGHRHLPEIKQGLEQMAGKPVGLVFVPHLTPMMRGIHATIYVKAKSGTTLEQVQSLYEQRYARESFVDVLPAAGHPETRSVRGSNLCRIAVHQPQNGNDFVILSVIDNLVKGAAGQAVQNMNVMFGLEESTGLTEPAIIP